MLVLPSQIYFVWKFSIFQKYFTASRFCRGHKNVSVRIFIAQRILFFSTGRRCSTVVSFCLDGGIFLQCPYNALIFTCFFPHGTCLPENRKLYHEKQFTAAMSQTNFCWTSAFWRKKKNKNKLHFLTKKTFFFLI
jgi:hypothetical protein